MPHLPALAAALLLALAGSAHGEGASCTDACVAEEKQCITTLGEKARGNCGEGLRVCVQRCDPQRMNTALLDGGLGASTLRKPGTAVKSCEDACAMSTQLCMEAGNPQGACQNANTQCVERCAPG